MSITKMCSFDTSSSSTGWCLFENAVYSKSGIFDFTNHKKISSSERFKLMAKSILDYLNKEKPQIVVAEMTVVSRNASAQRMLTMILGIIYGWCIENNTYFEMLRPTEWRSLITDEKKGRKREELKKWSIDKVKELFNIDVCDDESDAILIGQAYINKYKNMD